MKTRSQFWHLLENELAPGRSGNAEAAASVTFLLAVYWAAIAALPWLILFGDADGRGNVSTLLQSGLLPILWLLFLSFLTLWMSYVIIPEFRNILPPGGCALPGIQHAGALEFLFTRPANRRLIFRTRTAALAIMVLGPLFFDMGASFFAQKLFSFIHAPAVPRQIVPYAVWLTWRLRADLSAFSSLRHLYRKMGQIRPMVDRAFSLRPGFGHYSRLSLDGYRSLEDEPQFLRIQFRSFRRPSSGHDGWSSRAGGGDRDVE